MRLEVEGLTVVRPTRTRATGVLRVTALGLTFGLAGWLAAAEVPARAAPWQQGITCEWRQVDRPPQSNEQLIFSALPEYGFLAFDANDISKAYYLDVRKYPDVVWQKINLDGQAPQSKRVSSVSSGRDLGSGRFEIFTYVGEDGQNPRPPNKRFGRVIVSPASASGDWCPPPRELSRNLLGGYNTVVDLVFAQPASLLAVISGQYRTRPVDVLRLDVTLPNADWQPLSSTTGAPVRATYSPVFDHVSNRLFMPRTWAGGTAPARLLALDLSGGWDVAKWIDVNPTGDRPTFTFSATFLTQLRHLAVISGSGVSSQPDSGTAKMLDMSVTPPVWESIQVAGDRFIFFNLVGKMAATVLGGRDFAAVDKNYYYDPQDAIAVLSCQAAPVVPFSATPAMPDLAVGSISGALTQSASRTRPAPLAPCIRNLGAAPAPRFTVRADDGVTWTAPGLAAGQALCLEAKSSRGRSVTVDPEGRVREGEEGNNTREVPGAAVREAGSTHAGPPVEARSQGALSSWQPR